MSGPPESKASKRRITARQRERQALELRMAGATYAKIAEALGISVAGAHGAVMRALKRLNEKVTEDAEEMRRLELERLDSLMLTLWPQAKRGNQGAIDRILRIMKRRAELLGLDAPARTDVTTKGQPITTIQFEWVKPDKQGDVSDGER